MTTFDPEKITFFAKTDARGHEVAFGIKAKDRQRHMYVVGKTGMGKTTFLENMAAQDIMNGEGMAFIDPHGSAAENLLNYIPEHRVKDVIYFAPFDLDHPVSFNVMEDVGPDKRHLVVSGLMSTFKKIWVDAWSSRMEYILTNALLVLIEYPDTTLLSVNRLFVDKAYRKRVVEYCTDAAVKSFWLDEFANYTDRFAAEALPAIQNKVGQFTGNPLIRNIIGQPHSSFNIRELMDQKKILIMNLSKGLIGETNANLLGSMLTTRIYLAAMSRADLPVEQMKLMPNFYFYVDEFQSFANATFADILSEARKYHLNLIIAHQYIEQMEEDVRNAVFGNVGTTVAFRVGPFDAEVLETIFAPRFEATDLVNLGFAQIYLTLMIDGIGSQPFSAKTLPPVELPSVSCREMTIEWSRQQFTKPRTEVEKIVDALHAPEPPEPAKSSPDRRNMPPSGSMNQVADRRTFNSQQSNQGGSRNTTGKAKQQNSNDWTTKKKVVPEKSSDDLRQVLAKMAGESKGNIENDREKGSVPQVGEDKRGSPERKNLQKENLPSGNKWTDKAEPADSKKNDLRKLTPADSDTTTKQPTQTQATDLKQALAEALSGVQGADKKGEVKTDSHETQTAATPAKSDNVSTSQPLQKPTAHALSQQLDRLSQVRRVVIEHRQPPKVDVPQPADVTAETQQSTVDTSTVKRLLRQSDNERSPFNK